MLTFIQPILLNMLGRRKTKLMIIELLTKLVKMTDNQLDDHLLELVSKALLSKK
jgi:hypothetical protein